ncbi:MAG: hypothetical protein Q9203_003689 [Teloschistes exilis]
MVAVMVTPAAVTAPVLGVFGFGAGGLGGAGGYGVPIVHGVVRAGSVLVSVLSAGVAMAGRKKIPAKDENGPINEDDKENRNDNDNEEAGDLIQSNIRRNTGASKSSVRNPEEFSSLLILSSTNRTPLITLWTASWCSSCRTIKPLLLSLIEDQSIGEQEGGVGYAEVEIDSPTIGPLASQYFVNTIPTLLSFRAQEAVLEEKVVSVDEMKDREFMRMWIENEARRGEDRGGGGGISTGLFGGLFGLGEKH